MTDVIRECRICKKEKPASLFVFNKSQCKACKSDYDKQWREDNAEKKKEQSRKYYIANKESLLAKERVRILKNKEKYSETARIYSKKNREKISAYHREYYAENKEKLIKSSKEYYIKNKHKYRARDAKRRGCELERTPRWLGIDDFKLIESIYALSSFLTFSSFGYTTYNVDHVIPLQGNFVSGLHVPLNLSIIDAKENGIKGNRYEIF